MFRATRPLWTSSARALASTGKQLPMRSAHATALRTTRKAIPQTALLVHKTSYATKPPLGQSLTPEEEKAAGQKVLESHPESVSSESSVRHVVEPAPARDNAKPVSDGLGHDVETVKQTFSLAGVPRLSYILGLAGTTPYLATSTSVLYLAWARNTEWPTDSSLLNNLLIPQEMASHWLSVVEPIQLGYGAVIISFLGAIHWGLEFAEKVPDAARARFRYGLGVAASVVAWPTLLLPWQWGLTAQWAAFVGMWYADRTATIRGWAPTWYGTYRFVLTAIVGTAIMISLIGRMTFGSFAPEWTTREKLQAAANEEPYTEKWQKLEAEEKKKRKEEEEKKKQEEEKKKKEEEEKNKKKEGKNKKQEEKSKGGADKNKGDKEGDKEKKEEEKNKKQEEKSKEGADKNEGGKEGDKEKKEEEKSKKQEEKSKEGADKNEGDKEGDKKEKKD